MPNVPPRRPRMRTPPSAVELKWRHATRVPRADGARAATLPHAEPRRRPPRRRRAHAQPTNLFAIVATTTEPRQICCYAIAADIRQQMSPPEGVPRRRERWLRARDGYARNSHDCRRAPLLPRRHTYRSLAMPAVRLRYAGIRRSCRRCSAMKALWVGITAQCAAPNARFAAMPSATGDGCNANMTVAVCHHGTSYQRSRRALYAVEFRLYRPVPKVGKPAVIVSIYAMCPSRKRTALLRSAFTYTAWWRFRPRRC